MLIRTVATALRAGGALLMTVGHHAWTGTEADWLGVAGATMFWSHEGEEAYRRCVVEAGLSIRRCEFVPEGQGGHSLILATKPYGGAKSVEAEEGSPLISGEMSTDPFSSPALGIGHWRLQTAVRTASA